MHTILLFCCTVPSFAAFVTETTILQGLGTYVNGVAGVFAEYINITHTSMTELVVCSVTSKIGELSKIRRFSDRQFLWTDLFALNVCPLEISIMIDLYF